MNTAESLQITNIITVKNIFFTVKLHLLNVLFLSLLKAFHNNSCYKMLAVMIVSDKLGNIWKWSAPI